MSIASIALSGMHAASASLDLAAQRIARIATQAPGDSATDTTAMDGRRSSPLAPAASSAARPEEDMVGLLQSKNAFLTNLAVFKTADAMTGSLLDITE